MVIEPTVVFIKCLNQKIPIKHIHVTPLLRRNAHFGKQFKEILPLVRTREAIYSPNTPTDSLPMALVIACDRLARV